jgi:lipoprotein-anchoring transpeptidase ErfK/SrfK
MRKHFYHHFLACSVAVLFVGIAESGQSAGTTPAASQANVAAYTRSDYSHTTASPAPSPASSPVSGTTTSVTTPSPVPTVQLVISVSDQKMAILVNGKIYKSYPVSTSRYGEGDNWGSWRTPIGTLEIAGKIGGRAPAGAVFWRRQVTGEVLPANAPGRDPIVSRIIWLRGLEVSNRNAYKRCIYIHGTPQEAFLGRKASFGCIRMRSVDVIQVFNWVNIGTQVDITKGSLGIAVKEVVRKNTLLARNEPLPAAPRNESAPAVSQRGLPRTAAASVAANQTDSAGSPLLKVGPPNPEASSSKKAASLAVRN